MKRPGFAVALVLFAGVCSPQVNADETAQARKKFTLPTITAADVVNAGKLAANPAAAYMRYQERLRQRAELERLLQLLEESERRQAEQEETIRRYRELLEQERFRLTEAGQPRWFRPQR
jgi:hypothetical protein